MTKISESMFYFQAQTQNTKVKLSHLVQKNGLLPVLVLFFVVLCSISTNVSAQFFDDFSDGNVTDWLGDVDKFEVLNESLHLNDIDFNPPAILYNPVATQGMTEWQFFVNLDFAPSGNNQAKIYLRSNASDLTGSLNGYYVQIGESGSNDGIDLFVQTGNSTNDIIDDTSGIAATTPAFWVRVTVDELGNWEVFYNPNGPDNWISQGTGFDDAHDFGNFIGVSCKYSSGNTDAFYFDDFLVNPVYEDTEEPQILSASTISATALQVTFSEPVTTETAEALSNYFVDNLGNPSMIQVESGNSSVILFFDNAFPTNENLSLTVSNISDANGNILNGSTDFAFIIASPRDIVINEIFPDFTPIIGLPEAEFVELFNRTAFEINLDGWTFADPKDTATFENVVIPANDYLILCKNSAVELWEPFGATVGLGSFPSLNNGEDTLYLRDPFDNLIDQVIYDDSWYGDAEKKDGGYTLELRDVDYPCGGSVAWIGSEDESGGTPGRVNSVLGVEADSVAPTFITAVTNDAQTVTLHFSESIDPVTNSFNYDVSPLLDIQEIIHEGSKIQLVLDELINVGDIYELSINGLQDCSGNAMENTTVEFGLTNGIQEGDIRINEVFVDANPIIALADAQFVELFNQTDLGVDLSGWTFADSGAEVELTNVVIPANAYVILCNRNDAALWEPFGLTAGIQSFPSMTQAGDTLSLTNATGNLMDQVIYTKDWYGDSDKADGGYSLELRDTDTPCTGSIAWIASTDESGGTPGRVNSVLGLAEDTSPPNFVTAIGTDATSITLYFSETMLPISDASNYTITPNLDIQEIVYEGSHINLLLNETIDANEIYEITVSGLQDCGNNPMTATSAMFGLSTTINSGDIVINEIFADPNPTVGLPTNQFIELFNQNSFGIDLTDWAIADLADTATLSNVAIPGNGYLILCKEGTANLWQPFGLTAAVKGFPTLNQSDEVLRLLEPTGNLMDLVDYTKDWYGDPVKAEGGYSLELRDPNFPCQGPNFWIASEDTTGGTPGRLNSVQGIIPDNTPPELIRAFPQDEGTIVLVFSEAIDPNTVIGGNYEISPDLSLQEVIGDNNRITLDLLGEMENNTVYEITVTDISDCIGNAIDTVNTAQVALGEVGRFGDVVVNEVLFNPLPNGSDYVELYNRSDKYIDLSEWFIGHEVADFPGIIADSVLITEEPYTLFPDQYVVLTANPQSVIETYGACHPMLLKNFIQVGLPGYSDQEGLVGLMRNNDQSNILENVLDIMLYRDYFHFELLDDVNGVALERLNPDGNSLSSANWHSAAATSCYGTPTYKNSQFYQSTPIGEGATIAINPNTLSPNGDSFNDLALIQYQFPEPGYSVNITIYDDNGRRVRRLVRNEVLGVNGEYKWDGSDDNGESAPIGIYIIYIEAFNLDGDVETFKEICVVAGESN